MCSGSLYVVVSCSNAYEFVKKLVGLFFFVVCEVTGLSCDAHNSSSFIVSTTQRKKSNEVVV